MLVFGQKQGLCEGPRKLAGFWGLSLTISNTPSLSHLFLHQTSQTPKAHGSDFECSKAKVVVGNTEKSLKAELYMQLWGEVKSRVWNSEVILVLDIAGVYK